MSEEFKYIPYDPYDRNLHGLINKGNVYNLKNGLFLPENDAETDELIRDIEYMKEMYPEEIKMVSLAVEEECDKLEYEGSPMLVEYPDREEMRKIARKVYNTLTDQGKIKTENDLKLSDLVEKGMMSITEDDETGSAYADTQSAPPYVPEGPGYVNCVMRHIIEMLICNEFCVRRDRHRRRRRRFYL